MLRAQDRNFQIFYKVVQIMLRNMHILRQQISSNNRISLSNLNLQLFLIRSEEILQVHKHRKRKYQNSLIRSRETWKNCADKSLEQMRITMDSTTIILLQQLIKKHHQRFKAESNNSKKNQHPKLPEQSMHSNKSIKFIYYFFVFSSKPSKLSYYLYHFCMMKIQFLNLLEFSFGISSNNLTKIISKFLLIH